MTGLGVVVCEFLGLDGQHAFVGAGLKVLDGSQLSFLVRRLVRLGCAVDALDVLTSSSINDKIE